MHTKEAPLISVARVIRALLVIMGRNASSATRALTKIGTDKVHAPRYSKQVKQRADELKIPALMIGTGRNDIPVPQDGADPLDLQAQFFLKHLRASGSK